MAGSSRHLAPAALGAALDTDEVRAALRRVLESDRFSNAPRLQQFLQFVVEEKLAGNSNQLKAYTVGVSAFGYEPDFDPQANPYVRIVAKRLRKALDQYYAGEGQSASVRFTIPLGTYVPTIARPAPNRPAASKSGRRGAGLEANRVAVVRFLPAGDSPEEAWLASGLSADLVLNLGRFGNLDAIGPLRLARDGKPRSAARIARDYGAQFVLEGSVSLANEVLSLDAALVDAETGRELWTERYERARSSGTLLELQDSMTQRVTGSVADASGVIVRELVARAAHKELDDLNVSDAVLQWYHWNIDMSPETHAMAHAGLERAVELAPESALAAALLSDVYFTEWVTAAATGREALERAEGLARHAVAIAPHLDVAHWTLGQVHFGRRRLDEFHAAFDRALELNPASAQILASYGMFLAGIQDWDRAVLFTQQARAINPDHPGWYYYALYMNQARLGDWQAALVEAEKIDTGDLMLGSVLRAAALGHLGRQNAAAAQIDALLQAQPEFRDNGRTLLSRLMFSADNLRAIVEGLARASLELAESAA